VSDDLIGKELGKYELRERIGRGGMAEVYKAYHASLDRYVALKVLHPFLGTDPEFKERFEREARNVAQLRHPNIVQVYDFDFDPVRELYYMVMEYLDGPTLRTRLMQLSLQGELFTIPEALRITRSMASALEYAHSRDMIHRDLKPGNIMFDADGRVVLTDFGIARIVSGPNMTASGSMVGTPAYMSPEQGLGQAGDHRSDIYSLGVVLYQLVTGAPPFDADTPIAIVLKHVNDPLPSPKSLNPNIPEGLECILYKALAKSPEDRYQSVREMAHHLEDLDAAKTIILPADSSLDYPGAIHRPVSLPEYDSETPEPSAATAAPPDRSLGCFTGILMLLLSISAMVGGAYLSFSGVLASFIPIVPGDTIVLTATPSSAVESLPLATQPLEAGGTLTPDSQATELAQTVEALETLVVPPSNPTPDLTATVSACDYDYEIVSQSPEDGIVYPAFTSLTKRIVIVNDSRCPLDDDTRLEFETGYQLGGPNFFEFNRALQPGAQFEIVLSLQTPPYDPANEVVMSSWIIVLPDGTQVGPPLTFSLQLFPSEGDS
jgi:serine/threonine protein kinase